MTKSDRTVRAAFTLVELILVMALLAIVTALSAPALSRSMRERHVVDEAKRFLALTEYGRDEAISQAIPMTIWIDKESGHYGVSAAKGFTSRTGRDREYSAGTDVHFEMTGGTEQDGAIEVASFSPDGTLDTESSAVAVSVVDRFGAVCSIERAGTGFAISKEGR